MCTFKGPCCSTCQTGCSAQTAVRCNLSHCWWAAPLWSSSLSKDSQLYVDAEVCFDVTSMHQLNYFASICRAGGSQRLEPRSAWGVLCVAYAYLDVNKSVTLQVSSTSKNDARGVTMCWTQWEQSSWPEQENLELHHRAVLILQRDFCFHYACCTPEAIPA